MDHNTNRRKAWLAGSALIVFMPAAPLHAQQNCFPSKFGPNDQIGNLNHVTPEKTLAASKLITKSKAYRLAIETNRNTPAYPPRSFSLTVVQPGQAGGVSDRADQDDL